MLSQLTIRDFAIVDRLAIYWAAGLNVVTGETGAGKSIIIDAVGTLLGGRVSPDFVRGGADRALVEGVFDLSGAADITELQGALGEYGLDLEDGGLILAREVAAAGGRSVARINGRAVPASVLQQVGEQVVDIHGQSEHLSLLRPREHLELLDRYAGLGQERARLADVVADLRSVEREQAQVRDEARRAEREQVLLRHEVAQIEAASLAEGEEEELLAARGRLRNVERLRAAVSTAYAAINGDEDQAGAAALLQQAASACSDAISFDPALEGEAEVLSGTAAQLSESARTLRKYLDTVEEDPQQLEAVEERLLAIADLKRKFGDTIADVLVYADHARGRLLAVERQDQLLAELAERKAALREAVAALAADLSARRVAAAATLCCAVESELADLNMSGTRFVVQIEQSDDEGGVAVAVGGHERTLAFDQSGVDRVEFLIAANPGEEPKGLGRIASGGELARVSLALKAILSRVDRRQTLIFDEIDVGVGGRSAPVVGEKLWGLTAEHQVLCVTHMPQVAAYADAHLLVTKAADAASSRVEVRHLEPAERVDELAAILGGQGGGQGARRNAEELLERAAAWKRSKRRPKQR